MDREYQLLEIIQNNESVSQRELSKILDVSLGTVNILLKKMLHDGLLKIESIPAKRAVYMLTPKGVEEKIKKTINYLKIHYNAISDTKKKIVLVLEKNSKFFEKVYIYVREDSLNMIVRQIISSNSYTNVHLISHYPESLMPNEILIIDHTRDEYLISETYELNSINILEYI